MSFTRVLPLAFLLFLSSSANSQISTDYQLWTGFKFQFKLNKKIAVYVAPEIRINNRMHTVKSIFPEAGIKFQLNKRFDLRLGYRYSFRFNKNDKNRVHLDLNYELEKKGFILALTNRLRFQYQLTNNSLSSDYFLRYKMKFKLDASKKLDPYTSVEIFYKFVKNEFRTFRFSCGLNWKINKKLSLSSFYIYQREIYVASPSQDHIFGLTGKYSFKLKKKKSPTSRS